MIPVASGVQVWVAASHTDMRKGAQAQSSQRLSVRGRRGGLMKVLWHDGQRGCFLAGMACPIRSRFNAD
jgi:transposase